MEKLPDYSGWRSCYKGSRGSRSRIVVEPHEWDHEKMAEAYAPLIIAYRKIAKGQVMPPDSYKAVA